ncbi:ATP-binding protein [Asaia sp. HumB]|uniref:ATP-binding protein n=1 Tax=Asaia sp. HumB TaxID=3035475 RepID=UPI00255708EC|nr:ATP-binding protein [Asaia sp. HumB]MDL2169758.1 ATP-binding protein [Asaia sp. HumB]
MTENDDFEIETEPDVEATDEFQKKITLRKTEVKKIFTPSRPVTDQNIFSGRKEQLKECCSILETPGLHGILYGERGVGKTSFANIISIFLKAGFVVDGKVDDVNISLVGDVNVIKVECSSSDTFETLIKSIYSQVTITTIKEKIGFGHEGEVEQQEITLASTLTDKTSFLPSHVAMVFRQLPGKNFVIIDEFDRLRADTFSLANFADFLKVLSDVGEASNVHFLIIGVGESVSSIIGEHASIERNLTQVHMSTMAEGEITNIIKKGLKKLEMTMGTDIVDNVVSICCGYPHYAHLLCLYACMNALNDNRLSVSLADLNFAISKSIEKASDGLKRSYRSATITNKQNIYPEVLLACSICSSDEYGTFQPKDVEGPLARLLKRPIAVPNFGAHLRNLCKEERGNILVQDGSKGRRRYQFRNPLMRAFIRLKGQGRF